MTKIGGTNYTDFCLEGHIIIHIHTVCIKLHTYVCMCVTVLYMYVCYYLSPQLLKCGRYSIWCLTAYIASCNVIMPQ